MTGVSRISTLDRLKSLILANLNDPEIQVVDGPPRDPVVGLLISIGDITGDLSIPNMTRGRQVYDDHFQIPVICMSWDPGGDNHARSDATAQELVNSVLDSVADAPNLQMPAGDGLPGVVSALVGPCNGPNRWWTTEGVGTAMRVTVLVHMRLS